MAADDRYRVACVTGIPPAATLSGERYEVTAESERRAAPSSDYSKMNDVDHILFLNLAIPVTAVLMPEIFPRTIEWVLFWSSILLSSASLLLSGVPAALYERLVDRNPNAMASMWIWLAGAAALCVPAVLRGL